MLRRSLIAVKILLSIFISNYGCREHCCNSGYFDCQDYQCIGHNTSTIYQVTPVGMFNDLSVFCDFDEDGEGWIVIQRRVDGSVDFSRTWRQYEKGFGNIRGNYWIGLLPLWRFTVQGHYQLQVTMQDWDGTSVYAMYDHFKIGSPGEKYTLQAHAFSGTAADCMDTLNGHKFSTIDKDNDNATGNCALFRGGGWWHNRCGGSSLNGEYFPYEKRNNPGTGGIRWNMTEDHHYSYKFSEMKIKRA